jgi:hypothetical protein
LLAQRGLRERGGEVPTGLSLPIPQNLSIAALLAVNYIKRLSAATNKLAIANH